MSVTFIEDTEALGDLCADLKAEAYIAVDTEFVRRNTYFPQLSLIQIATADQRVYFIDPLKITQWRALIDLMRAEKPIKVFHSVGQDLEALYQIGVHQVQGLFDTQLAMIPLKMGIFVGYAHMISQLLGRQLSKSQTQTNWLQRPLTPLQLGYAQEDVTYLSQAYEKIIPQLSQAWLDALAEDFSRLKFTPISEVNRWVKWPFVHQLSDAQRALAQTLYHWRDKTAQRENLPKNWLLSDLAIQQWVKNPRYYGHKPFELPKIRPKYLKRYLDDLMAHVANSPEVPAQPYALYKRVLLAPVQEKQFQKLRHQRDALAATYHIVPPSQWLSNQVLKSYLLNQAWSESVDFGWRKKLIEEAFF